MYVVKNVNEYTIVFSIVYIGTVRKDGKRINLIYLLVMRLFSINGPKYYYTVFLFN